jgi:hypothetical protein
LASDRPVGCFTGADDVFTVAVGCLFFSSGTTGIVVATAAGRVVVSTTVAFCVGPGCGSTYVTRYCNVRNTEVVYTYKTVEIFQSLKELCNVLSFLTSYPYGKM